MARPSSNPSRTWAVRTAQADSTRVFGEVLEPAAIGTRPAGITDAQVEALRRDLGEAAPGELTMTVAVENGRSWFDSSLGSTSQRFSDRCHGPAGADAPGGPGQPA
jgi:hypothetical protein